MKNRAVIDTTKFKVLKSLSQNILEFILRRLPPFLKGTKAGLGGALEGP